MNRNARKPCSLMAALFAAFAALILGSCGSDYEKPSTTLTGSPLISASVLKSWSDGGKVNGTGYDRVVILDMPSSYGTYTTGHISGALYVDPAEIGQNRNEGIATSTWEVLDGSKMDELIQKYGIDGKTTIVFTSNSLGNPTRAYYTFRYWGFPKNRLKVLDGVNKAWGDAYGLTPGDAPDVVRSSYTVKSNGVLMDHLRVSLAEMIDYADGKVPNALAIDVRGSGGSYAGVRGSTGGAFSPTGASQGKTVFEGRIRGAKAIAGSTLYTASNVFKPAGELISAFTSSTVGLDSTKTAYLYCVKGAASSVTFFILDGILGWPAAVYDGSWSQWGQLSGSTAMMGQLDPGSPWRTDAGGRSELVVYNYEAPISAVTSTTAAASEITTSGTYTGATNATYTVIISALDTPDRFDWLVSTTTRTDIAITGAAQPLNNGLSIAFANTTGHILNSSWIFTATARKIVEQLTADGSACWATFSPTGTIVNSSGLPSKCANVPNSFDTDVNRIEEADRAYMSSGGSGGNAGGGTSVPAGC